MINVGDSIKMKQSSLARKQIKNIFFKALPKRETCRKIQNKSHREMCCLPRHTTVFKCTTIYTGIYRNCIDHCLYRDTVHSLSIRVSFLSRDWSLMRFNLRSFEIVLLAINYFVCSHIFIRYTIVSSTIVALATDNFISLICFCSLNLSEEKEHLLNWF